MGEILVPYYFWFSALIQLPDRIVQSFVVLKTPIGVSELHKIGPSNKFEAFKF